MKKVFILLILVGTGVLIFYIFKTHPLKITPKAPPENMANPASLNCKNKGGTTIIQSLQDGAQFGLCQFSDNMACEEWAMMRGECPVGGIKTTGYDNMGQKYCAWLGGQTFAVPNSQCKFPDGHTCATDALWAGNCN